MLLRCYPKITDWLFHFFNESPAADFRFLPIYSYGFFVAAGFFAAAVLAASELRRREKLGLLTGVPAEIIVGEKPSPVEMALNFLIGFVFGFKILGLFAYKTQLSTGALNIGGYFLSVSYGSWIGGILVGALLAGYTYYQKNKAVLPKPEKKTITIYPSDSVGDLVIIALVLGVLGSVLFNYLESPGDYAHFWDDPVSYLFSGLSVYGGLICAGAGFIFYARWKKFRLAPFLDSIAPGFIMANGLGRIGCQVAGDGDWGIANLHPKPDWIPQFLWSTHYQHNIINSDAGNFIPGCVEEHCNQLINPVYPTPLYEFLMCTAIFLILWSIRKRLTNMPFMLFSIFMILIGIQRYSIEQIRDISGRDLYFGFFRQSELISIGFFVAGVVGVVYLYRRYKNLNTGNTHGSSH